VGLACLALLVLLDSLWAYIPAGLIIALTFVRTAPEDRTLRNELLGLHSEGS
jgi:protein-S-isoprenylcysteine O-methyltransferase Ste14